MGLVFRREHNAVVLEVAPHDPFLQRLTFPPFKGFHCHVQFLHSGGILKALDLGFWLFFGAIGTPTFGFYLEFMFHFELPFPPLFSLFFQFLLVCQTLCSLSVQTLCLLIVQTFHFLPFFFLIPSLLGHLFAYFQLEGPSFFAHSLPFFIVQAVFIAAPAGFSHLLSHLELQGPTLLPLLLAASVRNPVSDVSFLLLLFLLRAFLSFLLLNLFFSRIFIRSIREIFSFRLVRILEALSSSNIVRVRLRHWTI
mmetsp:Transcript_34351/g.43372  ORF Transcript_34351/g.43372 Transcript_34351/m.43372 type:complete len:252 (-) Transcript_34351:35-790(-)